MILDEMKISIVTISFNCKDVIEKTVRSVINQTYCNKEYIIIDGGSEDGTVEIINNYSESVDYFVSEKDNGIYDAMNKGLKVASGEWIVFMNAGDFFAHKDVLKKFVEKIDDDTIVAYGDIIMQCNGYYYLGQPAGVDRAAEMMPVFHQATLVRTDYHKMHQFDTSFKSSGDYNFFYDCFMNNHCKFQYVPYALAVFDNTGGMSKDNHSLSLRENLRIWKRERDWLFRMKLEWSLISYNVVMWIKRKLSNDRRIELEINRVKKNGHKVFNGIYYSKLK